MLLLTGKLRIQGTPVQFSNGKNGYLKSIAYQTDNALANNLVINEITLNEDVTKVDRSKLLEIIKGLCLYEELLRTAESDVDLNLKNYSSDEKVIELLNLRKVQQFSSGQKQRFALAKLLYTMTESHQVIALDEAFNRLDDATSKEIEGTGLGRM